jgi:hypothetical protein
MAKVANFSIGEAVIQEVGEFARESGFRPCALATKVAATQTKPSGLG